MKKNNYGSTIFSILLQIAMLVACSGATFTFFSLEAIGSTVNTIMGIITLLVGANLCATITRLLDRKEEKSAQAPEIDAPTMNRAA